MQFHQLFKPVLLGFRHNGVFEILGIECSFLFGISKCAKSLESCILYKLHKFIELLHAFSRMSHNHGSSKHNSRDLFTHLLYECTGPCAIYVPMHHVKHLVSNMLERNIHVSAHLRIIGHLVKNIFRKISRI